MVCLRFVAYKGVVVPSVYGKRWSHTEDDIGYLLYNKIGLPARGVDCQLAGVNCSCRRVHDKRLKYSVYKAFLVYAQDLSLPHMLAGIRSNSGFLDLFCGDNG